MLQTNVDLAQTKLLNTNYTGELRTRPQTGSHVTSQPMKTRHVNVPSRMEVKDQRFKDMCVDFMHCSLCTYYYGDHVFFSISANLTSPTIPETHFAKGSHTNFIHENAN